MKDYKFINEILIRISICLMSSFIIIIWFYQHSITNPFELKSDYLQYYNFYNSANHNLDRFGSEFLTPLIYKVFNNLGVDFYQFVFLFGLAWLPIILKLSTRIKTGYLIFYFMYFPIFFVENYAFLFRTYLAFMFFLMFILATGKKRAVFVFLAIFSHMSAILFIFFSWLKLKSKKLYVSLALSATLIMILNQIGYGFSRVLLFLLDYVGYLNYDLQRKLSLLVRIGQGNIDSSGVKIMILLASTVLIHSLFINQDNKKFSFMRALFFSAIVALIFSDFKILANRLGFLAYYFSIPYFLMVLSSISLNKYLTIKFNSSFSYNRKVGLKCLV